MIRYTVGNIIESDAEALINTVNTVGVMGKGIAGAFKKAFPDNYRKYKEAVDRGEVEIGKLLVHREYQTRTRVIINFPTKKHWRQPSRMEYIAEGLKSLVEIIETENIRSIAIPPLGAGNGKLNWDEVKPLLESWLEPLAKDREIIIYEPGFQDQQTKNAARKKEPHLTPSRAIVLHVLDKYRILGYGINLLVVQKVCYFLQELGETLNLRYEKGHYGPYAHNLTHLLKALNTFYLSFNANRTSPEENVTLINKRLPEVGAYVDTEISDEQKARMYHLLELIEDFESPYGLELLGTVHYIKKFHPEYGREEIERHIHQWTNRKKEIMKPYHIQVAYERLEQQGLFEHLKQA